MITMAYINSSLIEKSVWCELIAQSAEHRPFKAVVLGSNPSQLTIFLFVNIF